jgi:hypothetical protein
MTGSDLIVKDAPESTKDAPESTRIGFVTLVPADETYVNDAFWRPPILAAIEGAGLVDCCVVVTRWFGGTKLGVGGLVLPTTKLPPWRCPQLRGGPEPLQCGVIYTLDAPGVQV